MTPLSRPQPVQAQQCFRDPEIGLAWDQRGLSLVGLSTCCPDPGSAACSPLGPPGSPPRGGVPRPAGCGHHGADDKGRFEKLPALPPPGGRGGFAPHLFRLRLQATRPWLTPSGHSLEQSEKLPNVGSDFKAVPSGGEGWKLDLRCHTSFPSLASISGDFPATKNQNLLCSGHSPRPHFASLF